jgi:hypothetical protein
MDNKISNYIHAASDYIARAAYLTADKNEYIALDKVRTILGTLNTDGDDYEYEEPEDNIMAELRSDVDCTTNKVCNLIQRVNQLATDINDMKKVMDGYSGRLYTLEQDKLTKNDVTKMVSGIIDQGPARLFPYND